VERWRVKHNVGPITRHEPGGRACTLKPGDRFSARIDEVRGYRDKLEHVEALEPEPGEAQPFRRVDHPDGGIDVYAGDSRLNDVPLTPGNAESLTTHARSTNWVPPAMLLGATVVILGGGPSLNDVNHDLWRGRYRCIGINNGYVFNPDALFFQDFGFWHKQDHATPIRRQFNGLVVTTSPQMRDEPRVHVVERSRYRQKFGLPDRHGAFPQITNAGHGAICLAYMLGAAKIVLLGFDGTGNGNWYESNPDPADEDRFSRRFRPGIESTLGPLRNEGVELINATPGSALQLPTTTPESIL